MTPEPVRIKSLDGLRGAAALVVLFYHCNLVLLHKPAILVLTPLRLLISGPSAVLVFFALSGFVLFLAISGSSRYRYDAFIVRRFMRIYPPFLVAILFASILFMVADIYPISGADPRVDINFFPSDPPTLKTVLLHLAMTDIGAYQNLDRPVWSLTQELRISVIFPLIVFLVVRNWKLTLIGSFVISVACAWVVWTRHTELYYNPFITFQYLFLFTGGACIALHARRIRELIGRLPGWARLLLWVVALMAITWHDDALLKVPRNLAALALVILCFGEPIGDRLLRTPAPMWLGRVSFSLYLVHAPILMAMVHLFAGVWPIELVFAVAVAVSLVTAEVFYRAVEVPSIALGRKLTAMLRPAPVAV